MIFGVGLDLVEIASQARPPVCKILDFTKFKYDQEKKKKESRKKAKSGILKEIRLRPPRVTTKELSVFTRQFATMINAGLPLVRCLSILGQQADNPYFKKTIQEVMSNVETGMTLAEALAKHEQHDQGAAQKPQIRRRRRRQGKHRIEWPGNQPLGHPLHWTRSLVPVRVRQ